MKNKFFMLRIFVFAGFAVKHVTETDKNIDAKEVFATQRHGN